MSNFCCRDEGVQNFLRDKAYDYDSRNLARTYLILDEEKFVYGEIFIVAYYTLSIKVLPFTNEVSKTKIKKIEGFSKNALSVGAILIGQFGKDDRCKSSLTGSEIMEYTLEMLYNIFTITACRIAFLECQPIEKIISFYKNHGFEFLQDNPKNNLVQMFRYL